MKQEDKIKEERVKRNEQSLQEIWDYVKRPNLHLIRVPECDGENKSKMENIVQEIIQENFPNRAKQDNIQPQVFKTETTTKIFLKKSNPKAHNC